MTDTPPTLDDAARNAIEHQVINVLRQVRDPEIPVNIYDLGLIYGVNIDAQANVTIRMTLTTPACPVAQSLPGTVENTVQGLDAVRSATVDLVWDPPWTKDRLSEAARLQLGLS